MTSNCQIAAHECWRCVRDSPTRNAAGAHARLRDSREQRCRCTPFHAAPIGQVSWFNCLGHLYHPAAFEMLAITAGCL